MSIDLIVKINNQTFGASSSPVRITDGFPIITWSWETLDKVIIDEYTGEMENVTPSAQNSYEIRIGTIITNWGSHNYVADVAQSGFILSEDRFWQYVGNLLERRQIYYGQILVRDDFNRDSGWVTFSFEYNSLPVADNVRITPFTPSVNDDLRLTYNFRDRDSDNESGTIVRWFKNGVHQRQFDNLNLIKSAFLQLGDIWVADVFPSDGYEFGERITSPLVKIVKTAVTVSDVKILPKNPNENDILKAEYVYSDLLENDNPDIRWFINESVIQSYNDQKTVRLDAIPGDAVRFEIRPDGGSTYVSSASVTIDYSDFVVYNLTIDGQKEPLEVSTIRPAVSWDVHKPLIKNINYVSVKIGTFYDADNIYTEVIQTNKNTFTMPGNLLERGVDYYISVAISDINQFFNYHTEHFRIRGSRWEESVSNATGWTMETIVFIEGSGTFDEEKYQVIRFHDGTKFGEVRIYDQKIGFLSQSMKLSEVIDTTGTNILTIVGEGDDVKIYFNRVMVIDGTGLFVQTTSDKTLEMGNPTGDTFTVNYKYFYYTISGAYHPGISEVYANLKFHTFLNFVNNEIVALQGYFKNSEDQKVFGVNPDNENESGSIYALVSAQTYRNGTVNRTFSPINNMNLSPDSSLLAIAHSKGASIITGYVISDFDHDLTFIDSDGEIQENYPEQNGWKLVQNVGFESAYFDERGFHINTIENVDTAG